MNMWIMSASVDNAVSISFFNVLESAAILAVVMFFFINLTASTSLFDDDGNPASMISTPSSSSACAIFNLSEGFNAIPGVCSPSRSVVSKILILREPIPFYFPHHIFYWVCL